jgi:hypothetical protein
MQQQALYVITSLGQDRFVWATSATEARAKVAAARIAMSAETGEAHADAPTSTRAAVSEQRRSPDA